MPDYCVFEYCYCDANNCKSWGSLLLEGGLRAGDIVLLHQRLESGEFFIAEQLAVPPRYQELWEVSDGPTCADHVWHTFHALRVADWNERNLPVFDKVETFVARFGAIAQWNEALSPHWRGTR